MRVQLAFPVFKAFDSSGDPLAGGKLYTYDTGTTTPRATYDNDGVANANPVILDGNGEAEVWLDNGLYRLVLHDTDDVLQWTIDSVTGIVAPASATETKTGTDDTLAITPAGLTLEVIDDRGFGVDAEASDAYAITLSPAPTAYYAGMGIKFSANTANTGACTLNVNALGAKAIKKNHDQDPVTGDIEAGQIITVIYDGTSWQMQSQLALSNISDVAYDESTWNGVTTVAPSKNAVRDKIEAMIDDTAYDESTWNGVTTIAPSKNAVRDEIEVIKSGTAVPLPRGYLSGLQMSNDTDTDHDIAVAVGECRDADLSVNISLASIITKQIDATWAAGDDAGGMNDGEAVGNATWYHVHLLSSADGVTVDAGFDTSLTAATLLADTAVIAAGLTKYRRLGSVLTDGSANIIGFTQVGNEFLWDNPPADISGAQPASALTRTLSVVIGVKVHAIVNAGMTHGATAPIFLYLSSLDADDEAPSETSAPLATVTIVTATDYEPTGPHYIRTNVSGQIRSRASSADCTLIIATLGWIDRRGKDD